MQGACCQHNWRGGDGVHLPDDTVSAAKLKTDSVIAAKISDGAVTVDKLGANAVTQAKVAQNAIGRVQMADDAVASDSLAPLTNLFEDASISASAFGANVNVSVLDNSVVYSTAAADRNICVNFRGDGSTSLNDSMTTGNSIWRAGAREIRKQTDPKILLAQTH